MCFHARRRSSRSLVVYVETDRSAFNVSHRVWSHSPTTPVLLLETLFIPGYQVHTSLLSVSGMASSSETDVARVKLLLTVAERWGSLCSTGLTVVDMAASGDAVKRRGQGRGRRGGFVDIVYTVRGRHNVGSKTGAGYPLVVSLLETGEEGEGRMADRMSRRPTAG